MNERKGSRRSRVRLWVLICALLVVASYPSATRSPRVSAAQADREDYVEAYERDVFEIVGSTLRNPDADTSPDANLFNVAGVALNTTWGEWTGGTGTASARSNGSHTDVELELSGLIPGGVYSVFYGTLGPDSEHPLCQGGIERTLPLTSKSKKQHPDPSAFIADASGAADYRARVSGRLLDAMQVFYFIVYHSDGMTYHPFPNRGEFLTYTGPTCRSSFGEDAMRQVLIVQKQQ